MPSPIVESSVPQQMMAAANLALALRSLGLRERRQDFAEQSAVSERAREQNEYDATARWYTGEFDRLNPPRTETVEGPRPPGGIGPGEPVEMPNPQDLARRAEFEHLPLEIQGEVVEDLRQQDQRRRMSEIDRSIKAQTRESQLAALERWAASKGVPENDPYYQQIRGQIMFPEASNAALSGMFGADGAGGTDAQNPMQVYQQMIEMGVPPLVAQAAANETMQFGKPSRSFYTGVGDYQVPELHEANQARTVLNQEIAVNKAQQRALQQHAQMNPHIGQDANFKARMAALVEAELTLQRRGLELTRRIEAMEADKRRSLWRNPEDVLIGDNGTTQATRTDNQTDTARVPSDGPGEQDTTTLAEPPERELRIVREGDDGFSEMHAGKGVQMAMAGKQVLVPFPKSKNEAVVQARRALGLEDRGALDEQQRQDVIKLAQSIWARTEELQGGQQGQLVGAPAAPQGLGDLIGGGP